MTTILCFLTIKYQLSNTLSPVCFEKIPINWEYTHRCRSMNGYLCWKEVFRAWFSVFKPYIIMGVLKISTDLFPPLPPRTNLHTLWAQNGAMAYCRNTQMKSPNNSTYYFEIHLFLKNNGFMNFYAIITISQKILWNGNYSIKTVIFSKRTMIIVMFFFHIILKPWNCNILLHCILKPYIFEK